MNLDLKGKTALVCSCTQGLGLASAIEIAKLGAKVILMARNEQKLLEALALLDISNNQKHGYLVADFSNITSAKTTIENFICAGNTVHILVNNTGGPAGGAILEADIEQFSATFSAHLLCNQILTHAVVPET